MAHILHLDRTVPYRGPHLDVVDVEEVVTAVLLEGVRAKHRAQPGQLGLSVRVTFPAAARSTAAAAAEEEPEKAMTTDTQGRDKHNAVHVRVGRAEKHANTWLAGNDNFCRHTSGGKKLYRLAPEKMGRDIYARGQNITKHTQW